MSMLFLALAAALILSVTAMAVSGTAKHARSFWVGASILVVFVIGNYVFLGRPDMTLSRAASLEVLQSRALAKMDETSAILTRSPETSVENWTELANQYWAAGHPDKAAASLGAAAAIAPTTDERDALLGSQAQALVNANDRRVGADARALFANILLRNPNDLRALFFLGLAAEEAGDKLATQSYWGRIIEIAPEGTPWRETLQARIGQVGEEASKISPNGPDSEMIRGMVARLAGRLAQDGGSADEWAQLGKSYAVLGQNVEALEAYDKAVALAPDDKAIKAARNAVAAAAQ